MLEYLHDLFPIDFVPHGFCMRWQSGVMVLHVISDLAIALAYFSIPIVLLRFLQKRRATHVMDVITLWRPLYRLAGVLKAVTAIVSAGTAITLIRLWPSLLQLPTTDQLQFANDALAARTPASPRCGKGAG